MIALPSETVVIDNESYTITMLDAVTGFALYAKLLNAVGGSLSNLGSLEIKGNVSEDTGAQTELAVKAIGALLNSLSPALLEELRAVFANSSTVQKDNKTPKVRDVFAFHFAGRYGHMSKWLFECAKVNFADFLDGALLDQLKARYLAATRSKLPQDSPGSSTA